MRVIVIDASNLIQGGGLTHLIEILSRCKPLKHKFYKIIIWAPNNTLNRIEDFDWIDKRTHVLLNKSLFFRLIWRFLIFPQELKKANYSLLFVPGGSDSTRFSPMVSMCQNMLPFETKEAKRFGLAGFQRGDGCKTTAIRVAIMPRGAKGVNPKSIEVTNSQDTMPNTTLTSTRSLM